ncbi:four helix bundle protein [Thalassotalea mangrovi]|uniref:Four helix bundle protein n=1 Tax=Thalassotalea mangrovi TaxID=2572245 RepID=A0A4U1B815_9GAMM|nr:four helix bundle protein [Thalassotalea mangrovi]TKB46132.1 four helix bundle protein [Thalassotalea mangrovi]
MNYEKLTVWKESLKLSKELYLYFKGFNNFGYKDQITRSGLSIPSNVAEGMARNSAKEKAHFLTLARGSCAELRTQIYIGIDIDYIDDDIGKRWLSDTRYIDAMLNGLRKKILEQSKP